MAKLTYSPLTSLTNESTAITTMNNNYAAIQAALENTLSRDGTSPNAMSASIDMNSNRVLNLQHPINDHEPVTISYLESVLTGFVYNPIQVEVSTIADLKTVDPTLFKAALVKELNREGIFIWRAGNYTSHVNNDPGNGVYVKANSVAESNGAWERLFDKTTVNITWFGARNDAVYENIGAQRAFTFAGLFKYNVRYPSGTYSHGTVTIDKGMQVYGSSRYGSKLYMLNNANLFNVTANESVDFSNFTILAPNNGVTSTATGGIAFNFDGDTVNQHSSIRDVRGLFIHTTVNFGKAQVWTLDNVHTQNIPPSGKAIIVRNTAAPGSGENQVSNCLFQGGDGITVGATTGIDYGSSVNFKMVNSEVFGFNDGFLFSGTSAAGLAGIYISNNVFSQNDNCIRFVKGSATALSLVTIVGNQLFGTNVIVTDSTANWLNDVSIIGNNIGAGRGDPLFTAAGTGLIINTGSSLTIDNNNFYGVSPSVSATFGANSSNCFFGPGNTFRGGLALPTNTGTNNLIMVKNPTTNKLTVSGLAQFEVSDLEGTINTRNLYLRDTGRDHVAKLSVANNLTADRNVFLIFGDFDSTLDFSTTVADIRAKTFKYLDASRFMSAKAPVVLTDAATIAVDMNTFMNATVTLGGNRTLGAPSNASPGQTGVIIVKQDATGNRTLAYNSAWKWPAGTAPTLSTAPNAVDIITFTVESASVIHATIVKDSR